MKRYVYDHSAIKWSVSCLLMLTALSIVPASHADRQAVLDGLQRSRSLYKDAHSWAARKQEIREGFLKGIQLWPLPEHRPPVKAIIHSQREYEGYSVENVALETMPGFYCTGNLYRPSNSKPGERHPLILCPHGHYRPLGRFRENQQIRCAHFARMGAIVFSYSLVGWQDSQQTTHDDPLVLALQTWSSLRAVDYLCSRPDADPLRVGVTGASGGGTQSLYLSLIDDRVKVSAPVVILYPWAAPEFCCNCEGGMPIMRPTGTNAIETAAAVAPTPQLIISVGGDSTKDFPEVCFPFILNMYSLMGAGQNVKSVHFPAEGHDFGISKRNAVFAFFAKHLDLPLKQEATNTIPIESSAQMRVFDRDHPLPAGAAMGAAQVAQAFAKISPSGEAAKIPADPVVNYPFKDLKLGRNDEDLIFTPPGFDKVGVPARANGDATALLKLKITDASTGKPTFCRVNVVGPDGNYYEPPDNPLTLHSLTGEWPKWPNGWGNRPTKAPARYFGRFFYSDGTSEVKVPAGNVRIEVWKGFEYRPETVSVVVEKGTTLAVRIPLDQPIVMHKLGFYSGDPHIHIKRASPADEQLIFDLMEAEDIRFGSILAYNDPPGPYSGEMKTMVAPQSFALGSPGVKKRGPYSILSGQEYRSSYLGHLNLFNLNRLVLEGQSVNADNWPMFGMIATEARRLGGYAFYAHGGYAKEIYADVVQDKIDGVELLQFGVYRGIGLTDWYHILNSGFRFPALGACDYPACRKLGDCKTYVYDSGNNSPTFEGWLKGAAQGRSFMTSGPLLFLEVDGEKPGAIINKDGNGPYRILASVRSISHTAPITNLQLIANGRIVKELKVPPTMGRGSWLKFELPIELTKSAWIAARAFSRSPNGNPDAESHTNPVYINLDGKTPYEQDSLDVMVKRIEGQIEIHKKRDFPEKARVLAYFQKSHDILMKIRALGGPPAQGHPSAVAHLKDDLQDPGLREHSEDELKAYLKPMPPRPMNEFLKTFETVGGFEMQLVAAEPHVHDPVAGTFDENGNLYIAEMRDYPYKPKEGDKPIGTVRLLRDTDGDGNFDRSHVFADGLLWAAGIAPWKGGVFVAAPPDIWYLKDTNGDFVADVRKKIFTGFGTANQQAMVNNLIWGMDHKIYGATAHNGGTILPAVRSNPLQQAPADRASKDALERVTTNGIVINGKDFRFDPTNYNFETITGTVQFGNTFDDWGNRFVCSESLPLVHIVLPERYLARNPYLAVPRAMNHIAPPPVPIHRGSPVERWREVRSSRRIAHKARSPFMPGASHHVIDAASGISVYRGSAYDRLFRSNPLQRVTEANASKGPLKRVTTNEQFYNDVFIPDAQNNLIHRRKLLPTGITFESKRADPGVEFVRSSDNWFRPVNMLNAPDGTQYVLDMSREIIESIHIPSDVVKHLDLKSGRKYGRIFRLAPPGFKYPGPIKLGHLTTEQLVKELESPDSWRRDTAHRLIFERQDKSAVGPLRSLLEHSSIAPARLLALWSLTGLESLTESDLVRGLQDTQSNIQAHSIRLSEPMLRRSSLIRDRVLALAGDSDIRVRYQCAFTLGELASDEKIVEALAKIAAGSGDDYWLRMAVLSSANESADELFTALLGREKFILSESGKAWVPPLLGVIGSRNKSDELARTIEAVVAFNDAALQNQTVLSLGRAIRRAGGFLVVSDDLNKESADWLSNRLTDAKDIAVNAQAPAGTRSAAIQLLACTAPDNAVPVLSQLIDIRQPESVQQAAVRALASYTNDEIAATILDPWTSYAPSVRESVTQALLSREKWTLALLRAAHSGQASLSSVDSTRRSLLLDHKNTEIKELAQSLLGSDSASPRKEIAKAYEPALQLKGDPKPGHKIFKENCIGCHKLGNEGHAIGPDLTSSTDHEPKALLTHIFDPNDYVLPKYLQYALVDVDGRIFTGMISAQTATSITLQRENNESDTILRTKIDEMSDTGRSLMPEGLEEKINQQQLADLIAYLKAAGIGKNAKGPPLERGTLPGPVEPE